MSRVTIILPTYNRARFLDDAFASIEAQTLHDWDLVVIDDGSTDDTEGVVRGFIARATRPVQYVRQANQGAYGARNTGLDHARAPLVAFFDSDDLWLPHHLERCAAALDANGDVAWVFAACQRVNTKGDLIDKTTFEADGQPRPFTRLQTETRGPLHVIVDAQALECHFQHGIYCGLQNSVMRRTVFEHDRFFADARVVEDALFLARTLLRDTRIGFLTDVHVTYRIHDANSTVQSPANDRAIFLEQIHGLERLRTTARFTASQRAAFNACLARHYFWHLGYLTCWQNGDRAGGLAAMRKGLALAPRDPAMWRTYVTSRVKALVGLVRAS